MLSSTGGADRLGDPKAAYFKYPAELPKALLWTETNEQAGRETHGCPHLLTKPRRLKENSAPIRALWADADDNPLPDSFPEPTIVIQSSPGKSHFYWTLRHALTPEKASSMSRRLTSTIGADPGGWPLACLLRLPGSPNLKSPRRGQARITSIDRTLAYHPREIEQYFKPVEEAIPMDRLPIRAARLGDRLGDRSPLRTLSDLDTLSPRMQLLISEGNAGVPNPYPSRSEADFAVAIAMFGANFEEEAVWETLSDPANGISEKYLEKGRYGHRYLQNTIAKAQTVAEPATNTTTRDRQRRRPTNRPVTGSSTAA